MSTLNEHEPEPLPEGETRAEAPAPAKPTSPKPKRRRARRITLRVTVPWLEYHMTNQAAKSLADGGLAEVLAAFVSDWVVAEERPGSWEADRVNSWLASHTWPKKERLWWEAHQARQAGKEGA